TDGPRGRQPGARGWRGWSEKKWASTGSRGGAVHERLHAVARGRRAPAKKPGSCSEPRDRQPKFTEAEPGQLRLPPEPSPAVAGRPLRVSKGGGRSRRRRPGDMERKGLPAAAGPLSPPRHQSQPDKEKPRNARLLHFESSEGNHG